MPIIEHSKPDSPITQGDILNGITLFVTLAGWLEEGGEPGKAPSKLCLVVSRPCVAAHKARLIVAGVQKYPDPVPRDIKSFAEVLDFLTNRRDGGEAPDLFYLGQLPGQAGRFCARLDSLHTVEVPSDVVTMARFLKTRRIATLHRDFARDLHVRLFNAFANLGFDDISWPSTDDLNWLVTQGRADIAALEQAVFSFAAQKASLLAEGKQFKESDLTNAAALLAELRNIVKPYEDELERRRVDGNTATP